jgi:hypothetical protein
MKTWTVVGIYPDRRQISKVERVFSDEIRAETVSDVERLVLERNKQAKIAAIFEGAHPNHVFVNADLMLKKPASDFGHAGWTFVGVREESRERFYQYIPSAYLHQGQMTCGLMFGRNSRIIAAMPGDITPADANREPLIFPEKTWTVCGIWETGDAAEPFTDSIVAEDAEEAERLISEKQPSLTIAGIFEGEHKAHDAGRASTRKSVTPWTVVGILQETGQRYAASVEATSWMAARDICLSKPGDLAVAAVLEGHLEPADARLASGFDVCRI